MVIMVPVFERFDDAKYVYLNTGGLWGSSMPDTIESDIQLSDGLCGRTMDNLVSVRRWDNVAI